MVADSPNSDAAQLAAESRTLLARSNRLLLGATIGVDDTNWHAPSRLPGWTRGHVATHLARNADALARLAYGAHTGTEQEMYPDDREAEIEAGAARTGVELQTDLDRTTKSLDEELDRVADADAWSRTVVLRGGRQSAAWALPSLRLAEVVLHHVDLDIGYEVADIDTATAVHCLGVCANKFAAALDYPPLRLLTENSEITIGDPTDREVTTVVGPANLILGWVTDRSGTDGLDGATVELPGFG